jgi:hypothetical protein
MALTTGFELPFGVQPRNPLPVDTWSGPYEGLTIEQALSAANENILPAIRFRSMEVRLIVNNQAYKYWYKNGIADEDLVKFQETAFFTLSVAKISADNLVIT